MTITNIPIPSFTDRARKVMQFANQEAQRLNHNYIGTEHLLLGLLKAHDSVAAVALSECGLSLDAIRNEINNIVVKSDTVTMGKLPHTPRTENVLKHAQDEADSLRHRYIGTEHLLLGLLREHESIAANVLEKLGVRINDIREEVLRILGETPAETSSTTLTFEWVPKWDKDWYGSGFGFALIDSTGKCWGNIIATKGDRRGLYRAEFSPLWSFFGTLEEAVNYMYEEICNAHERKLCKHTWCYDGNGTVTFKDMQSVFVLFNKNDAFAELEKFKSETKQIIKKCKTL